jgi:SAM-dependent methyltransferase
MRYPRSEKPIFEGILRDRSKLTVVAKETILFVLSRYRRLPLSKRKQRKERSIPHFAIWSGSAILLGAFLLFQVQPVISKMILPWFGGSPMVWTTCLLFFQTLLLAGYAYAHLLSRVPVASRQALVHLILVVVALVLLPITPGDAWKPADGNWPMLKILCLLAACVGLPYFLLAATSPLVQAWFARVYPQRSPYRLYALSNFGSLAALVTYPFLVEPVLATADQGLLWSVAFVVYAVLCGVIAVKLWRARGLLQAANATREADSKMVHVTPTWRVRALWLLLPAFASVLLMSITNHLCQNVAVVPFLWIAPLTLYLLSFIICFDRDAWYLRYLFSLGAVLAATAASYLALGGYQQNFWDEMGYGTGWYYLTHSVPLEATVYLALLFTLCMVCHGELVRLKPPSRQLTSFYLTIAAGGAVGGLLVAVICPLVFSTYLEMNLALIVGFFLAAYVLADDFSRRWFDRTSRSVRLLLSASMAVIAVTVFWGQWESWDREKGIVNARSFYGVLSVKERFPEEPGLRGLALYHGDTLHGYEHLAAEKRGKPTTYYTPNSGVGRAFQAADRQSPLRVGAVGLGVGTVAYYARPGDTFRFYEIDPLVIELADRHFSFLENCRATATVDIVPGDARLSLEREDDQQFDILVLDAFSGDTIPVHLLTTEAFDIYLRHLKPDGVIVVHVSSRYVDLIPVVMGLARHFDLTDVVIRSAEENPPSIAPADWMLLTNNQAFLDHPAVNEVGQLTAETRQLPLWTDQYNNLFSVLRRAGSAEGE